MHGCNGILQLGDAPDLTARREHVGGRRFVEEGVLSVFETLQYGF